MTTNRLYATLVFAFMCLNTVSAQVLTVKDAINTSLANYGTIKAKQSYAGASKALIMQAKRDYVPNLNLSAQQDYGTVNGQNGPLYGFGGFGVASSGLPLAEQNWNAAFGSLYLANVNWDFFTFGRVFGRIKIAKATAERDQVDLEQEQFQHKIKVAAAYLNLLAAQRIVESQQRNLERANVFKNNAVVRAANGLIPGVDSSFAAAEVSRAKIQLTQAIDAAQERANQLAVLMGVQPTYFELDTTLVHRIPASILNSAALDSAKHPLLRYYQSRVELSNQQLKYYRKSFYPTFSMFGIIQGRGSGFSYLYTQDQTQFNHSYPAGATPTRANYLVGVGMNWNLTTVLRGTPQVKAQKLITQGLQDEYTLANQQVTAQLVLAEQKIRNAMDNYAEAPVQVKSANDAYLQRNTLYKNGLTTIVDVTQAMYTLNRAETDRDIAYNNVWQALLLKAAAAGDPSIFMNEF
ncbi:MAG: TolC family protein [Bacteroidetes bacterium]|nr:TolC family protein [Bacteroidota bacterium]